MAFTYAPSLPNIVSSVAWINSNSSKEANQKRKELIEIFSYFDKDQTGIINVSELRNVMQILNQNDKSHVDTLLTRAEIEGNGYINYRDFVYYIIK